MRKLNKIFSSSPKIDIDKKSKIVIMSDCHRGEGNNDDNFLKNETIYNGALKYYLKNNFTYIELGDGDELWEVKNINNIINGHKSTFKLLENFNKNKRLLMLVGNHDIEKLHDNNYYGEILKDLSIYESLILNYEGKELFLLHGHQVDLLNSTFWRTSRFLVRHIWKPLEKIGFNDPTSAAKNYRVAKKVEKKLENWSNDNNKIVIAGHTHRPILPETKEHKYFNDGSCVHPNGITALEIEHGGIKLVRWGTSVNDDQLVSVTKEDITNFILISNFFED